MKETAGRNNSISMLKVNFPVCKWENDVLEAMPKNVQTIFSLANYKVTNLNNDGIEESQTMQHL